MSESTVATARAEAEAARRRLEASVAALRAEVTQATDWRARIARDPRPVLIAAALAGFVIGGGIAALTGR